MTMVEIFKPIRRQLSAYGERAIRDPAGSRRENRVGTKPVTNTSPPGPELSAVEQQRRVDEQGWMALLELVFLETGWPDAES